MKKWIVLGITAVFFIFQGSTTWEGAAAVAPAGELPQTGFFIATNSFPRNTVVDITNIETGRSVRVIVANNLESPGLLALISREAAELIGLRSGSVGRIRLLQPSEPIAFMRFTEGAAAGVSVLESEPVLSTEERLFEDFYREDTYIPPVIAQTEPPAPPVSLAARPGYIVDEPEWGGSGRLNIVDVPVFNIEPLEPFAEEIYTAETIEPVIVEPVYIVEEEPIVVEPVYIVEEEPIVEEPVYIVEEEPIVVEPVYIVEEEPIVEEPVYIVEEEPIVEEPVYIVEEEPIVEEPVYIVEEEPVVEEPVYVVEEEPVVEEPVYVVEEEPIVEEPVYIVEEEPVVEEPVFIVEDEPEVVYSLVQTDERVPPFTGIYGIDPSLIIPGITAPEPERPLTFIPAIPQVTTIPPAAVERTFSVRTISSLDIGQFYVQLASLPSADHVEDTIMHIDSRYNPVVFRDRDNLYRVLIGPLNQGESAAVLRRFRSIGYTDAFVRRGG